MAWEGEGDELDLAELSRASRVSPRTIRYYIHEGRLPSPGKRGRGARYDRGLVNRLELIKLLQRDGWPLGKIAERMRELDEEGVRREVEGGGRRVETGEPPILTPASSLIPQRSIWERVRIDPNLEISVRTPLSAQQKKLADRLVELARAIFEKE
jgi:DNA-binding transcriptional MerR regulator